MLCLRVCSREISKNILIVVREARILSLTISTINEGCYALKQDVNYPMYLVQMWSKQATYEPGGHREPVGFAMIMGYWQCWRQCWTYIGDEEMPLK